MSEDTQVPAREDENAPKQKTRKGYEIPVPKRVDVMAAFKKIVRGKKR